MAIIKYQQGGTQQDNTRVSRPIIMQEIPYKLKPNEFYFVDKKTGKKTLIKRKQETISEDKRSNYQRQQDDIKTKQIQKQQEQDKNYEKGIETIDALTKLTLPSTYVGPLFNNNGKSYTDNLISGEGTGNTAGNAAIDLLTPFAVGGINKGIQAGNRLYRIRQFSKALDNSSPELEQIPLNIGWGPKQTISVSHASDTGDMQLFFPKRWDVVNEGANPHGIWFQGKLGTPRTDFTNPGKGVKAARARALFANRPVQMQGNLTLEKPMITVGDVPNRSQLSYYADNAGADGLIYNGVYDNGYNNNQVILSFKNIVRSNGKRFGKLSFKNGDANVDGLYKKVGEGSEAVVYEHPQHSNKVLKIYTDYPMNPDQAAKIIQVPRNKVPFQEPLQFEGLTSNGYPVFSQNRVTPLTDEQWTPDLINTVQEMFKSKGYIGDLRNSILSNGKIKLIDISPQNMGYNSNGELRMIDIFPDIDKPN